MNTSIETDDKSIILSELQIAMEKEELSRIYLNKSGDKYNIQIIRGLEEPLITS